MAEDYIFIPNKNKEVDNFNPLATTEDKKYYTILGDHEFIDDAKNPRVSENSKNILARSVEYKGTTKYYVKTGIDGSLFNPIGMYSEGRQNKFLAKIGKNEFTFKTVKPSVFQLYLKFLASKNIAWLNNAQRETI